MKKIIIAALCVSILTCISTANAQRVSEKLNRGLVAVKTSANQAFLSWRILGNDPENIAFNVYRNGIKLNTSPISTVSNFIDNVVGTEYSIKTVIDGIETGETNYAPVWANNYKDIVLSVPASLTMPDKSTCNYTPNDCSVGDVDGDGEYEIVVKWDPTNAKDNSQSGYTGNVYIDVYKLNGTHLHRIDLGKNIRAGAHYTQFMVADFDGDGKAEIACKTAPGTKDGKGNYISKGPAATAVHATDYRNSSGYILTGPEYMTVFSGISGEELATANYNPARGTVSSWGDSYGNRVDRFLGGIAWLDGILPSIVMVRGYYTRAVIAAWDYRNGVLTNRWTYDSGNSNVGLYGQGNHNMSVADVDNDGKDEIIWGAGAVDHDGKLMYRTGLGHGDAMHLTDLVPDRKGLELWTVHESTGAAYGEELHDAKTGEILWGTYTGTDNGRGLAANIVAGNRGFEMWSGSGPGVMKYNGSILSSSKPSMNFRIYWDGDLQDELLDGTSITKYGIGTIFSALGCLSNNGTKSTPNISADILGDWREEVIFRTSDNTKLRIFTTTVPTSYKMYTLMHDAVYRNSIAWQNVAYNQPPHAGFYIGDDMDGVPVSSNYNKEKRWKNGNTWDNQQSASWIDSVATVSVFKNGDHVLFDISAASNSSINVVGDLQPGRIKINSPFNIVFNGTGTLSSNTELLKTGSGTLTLNNSNTYSGKTYISEGEFYNNGYLANSEVKTNAFVKIGGKGKFAKKVQLAHLSNLSPGNQAGETAKISFEGGLTEKGAINYYFDIKMNNGKLIANDTLLINENWTLNGKSTFVLSTNNGTLTAGEYPLIECNAEITGDLNQIQIVGVPTGFSYYLKKINNQILLVLNPPASLIWSAAIDNKWDNGKTSNWLKNAIASIYNSSDTVTFNDNANSKTVLINEIVNPGNILVDASSNYSFTGNGSISGENGINKNGSGKLTISTQNNYTGKTIVNNGIIEFATINKAGLSSPIGAANANAANVLLNGGKLSYTGTSASTDKGITLGQHGGTIAVNNNTTVLSTTGLITGTGKLTKEGLGRLALSTANNYAGGTLIKSGSIALTTDIANSSALGTETITIQGGSLVMFDSPETANTSNWKINVPTGAAANLSVDGNSTINGSISGGGNLYYYTNNTQHVLSANLSDFNGTINVTTDADGGNLLLYNTNGYANTKFYLNNLVKIMYRLTTNITIPVGDLTGATNSILGAGGTGPCTITWEIGSRNANSTFSGKITNDQFSGSGAVAAIRKVGNGTWTLTNANTYSGGTTINNGTLLINSTSGSALGTGNVTVNNGAKLAGNGNIAGSIIVNEGGFLAPGNGTGNLIVEGAIKIQANATLMVDIDKSTNKNDVLTCNDTIYVAGKLDINPLSTTVFTTGDEFKIMDGTILGYPTEIIPATPGVDLEWDLTNFTSNGTIKVKTATGLKTVELSSSIFPIPCKNELNIHLNEIANNLQVSLFNLIGNEVYVENFNDINNIKIDVQHLNNGIYTLQLKMNDKTFSRKIVKE